MEAMKSTNDVMTKVNEQMSVQNIQSVIKEFSKNSEKFGMQQEIMQDAMDMAFDNPEADQEADDVYNQICEEQGLSQGDGIAIGSGAIGVQQQANKESKENAEVDDLQARLDNLNQWELLSIKISYDQIKSERRNKKKITNI